MSRPRTHTLTPLLFPFLLLAACIVPWLPTAHASSAAGQDTLIGVVGRDFIILGADSSSSSSVMLTSSNLDKIMLLTDPFPDSSVGANNADAAGGDDAQRRRRRKTDSWRQQPIAAAAAGDAADADRLLGVLAAHCAVREYEAGVGCDVASVYVGPGLEGAGAFDSSSPAGLDAEAVGHLARGEIAASLRSGRGHLKVCLLVAGMVRTDAPAVDSIREGCGIVEAPGDDELRNRSARDDVENDDPSFSGRIRRQVEAAISSSTSNPTLVQQHSHRRRLDSRQAHQERQQQLLTPRLLWLDEYGSLQRLQYGAHGFGSNFALSILDRGYRPNMTRAEAEALVRDCFDQLRTRYVINSPMPPCVKCIDSDGCRLVSGDGRY